MKGIHPEFLLGKKGSHFERVINSLAALGGDNSRDYDKCTMEEKKKLLLETKYLDQNKNIAFFKGTERQIDSDAIKIKNILEIHKAHKNGSFRIYSVGKNFFEAVSTLSRDIPFKYIGADGDVVFLRTPPINMNGVVYNGCYIRCMDNGVMLMPTPRDFYTIQGCRIVLSFSADGKFGIIKDTEYFIDERLEIDTEYEETQVFADFTTQDHEAFSYWMNGVINTSVYINSQDPDIEELRPLRFYDRKQLSSLENTKKENLCTLPVRLVHWGYYRRYNVDSTTVSGHFRWQPYKNSPPKLIWIEEHTRNYNHLEQTVLAQ